MNAALAFLNGAGRERLPAGGARDDVSMMNLLLANCEPAQRCAARAPAAKKIYARSLGVRTRSVSTALRANGLMDVEK
jgi:hypothetical protein